MGCGGSRAEAIESVNASLEGLTGDALAAAMRANNAKDKWKGHKAPIDMDLLKELGLADDDEDKPAAESESTKGSATSRKSKTAEQGETNAENG